MTDKSTLIDRLLQASPVYLKPCCEVPITGAGGCCETQRLAVPNLLISDKGP